MHNMLTGFLSIRWLDALQSLGAGNSEAKMEFILSFLWDSICEPVWFTQNEILHSTTSHVTTD